MSEENKGDLPAADTNPTPTTTKEVALKLECPECGGSSFHVEKGLVLWCNSCGRTATAWAYQDKAHAELARVYATRSGSVVPGRKIHDDTPVCKAKRTKASGDYVECNARDWQHNGKILMYCRVCGANHPKQQPENVKAIIDTLGPAAPSNRTPQSLSKKPPEEFGDGAKRTQPGVDLEEYRARSGK